MRSIARTLGINKNTVVSPLKKQTQHVNPYVSDMIEHNQLKRLDVHIYYTAETDEFWSYVGKKSNQRWRRYAMDKSSGIILDIERCLEAGMNSHIGKPLSFSEVIEKMQTYLR